MISLGNAAKTLGISKPTLSKAISRGQLSAQKNEDGSFSIDPSELMRWYENAKHRFQSRPVAALQPPTPANDPADTELKLQAARLEIELQGLRVLLRVHREQIDDLKAERDKILGLVDTAHRMITYEGAKSRRLWSWFKEKKSA
jgi:hypothetical protein